MTLTKRTRAVLILGLLTGLAVLLYPPWQGVGRYGTGGYYEADPNHYGWVFEKPSSRATIDVTRLVVQLVALAVVCGLATLVLNRSSAPRA